MGISNDLWRRQRRANPTRASIRLTPIGLALCAVWASSVHAQQAPASAVQATTLPALNVTAAADATTEDSGSYAARSATVAGKAPVPLKETPASVSVLTRQRMDDQDMSTIQEALRYVTGVSSIDYGDGTAYFRARGSQLGVEFDGVSLLSGLQYQPQFDLAIYDRIEVLRGPAGVQDGEGNPGGTVNLVRKRPQKEFHVSTETQVTTFGGVRQMVDVTGALNKDGTLRGRAVVVGSDEHGSEDGTRNKEFTAYGALDWDLTPRTKAQLSAGFQVNKTDGLDYGAPVAYDNTGSYVIGRLPGSSTERYSPEWNFARTSTTEVNANVEHTFENGLKWTTTALYRHLDANSQYAYSGPGAYANGLSYVGDQAQQYSYNWFGLDSHVTAPVHLFGREHTFTLGASYTETTEHQYYGYQSVDGPGGGVPNVVEGWDGVV